MSLLLVIRDDQFRDHLVSLGVKFAAAKGKELYTINLSSGSGLPDVGKIEWSGDEVKSAALTTPNPFRTIKDAVAFSNPEMLMLNDASDHSEQGSKMINQAINEITCEVMVVRLGGAEADYADANILMPC